LWIWFPGTRQIFIYSFPIILLHTCGETDSSHFLVEDLCSVDVTSRSSGKVYVQVPQKFGSVYEGKLVSQTSTVSLHSNFLFTINYHKNICTIFPTAIILHPIFLQYIIVF
jgi:hypothetical protein